MAGNVTGGNLNRNTTGQPVRLLRTTVANAPSASIAGAGAIIFVSNGNAGSACLAVSDGTNWKVVALGATIAAA